MDADIELNDEFQEAVDLMENTSQHLFITGKAGTGKSTLLRYFRKQTKKNIVVLAPTGVAALNVQGQTIHSFFGLRPGNEREHIHKVKGDKGKVMKNLQTLVIDEVSMVRADMMDCIDMALRLNRGKSHLPFGGVQMIFIGDLYQLPPVVTYADRHLFEEEYASPYFFSAAVFTKTPFHYIELEQVYRQKDETFIEILNRIRNQCVTDEDLRALNGRYIPGLDVKVGESSIQLTSTNRAADAINTHALGQVKEQEFEMKGKVDGKFGKRLPAPTSMAIKVGAQVMMLNNDRDKRWVNGSIGVVLDIKKPIGALNTLSITVQLTDGKKVTVEKHTWETVQFVYDEDSGGIQPLTIGSYVQYPLMLAWAVTIHKAQGKTFDDVVIDVGRGAFAHGQMYVALSRCTSLEGVTLRAPFRREDVLLDKRITVFVDGCKSGEIQKGMEAPVDQSSMDFEEEIVYEPM
jgi:ATP-dependent DNA helicase PIF1